MQMKMILISGSIADSLVLTADPFISSDSEGVAQPTGACSGEGGLVGVASGAIGFIGLPSPHVARTVSRSMH